MSTLLQRNKIFEGSEAISKVMLYSVFRKKIIPTKVGFLKFLVN